MKRGRETLLHPIAEVVTTFLRPLSDRRAAGSRDQKAKGGKKGGGPSSKSGGSNGPKAMAARSLLMRCEYEVLATDVDVSSKSLFLAAEAISLPGVSWRGWRTEPLFYGLEKLIIIVRLCIDEKGGSPDDVLAFLQGLEGVQSARLLATSHGADAFERCSQLFSVRPEGLCSLDLSCLTAKAALALMQSGWATIDDWMPAEVVEGIASISSESMSTRSGGGSDGVAWRSPEPRNARTDVATWLNKDSRPASDPLLAEQLLPKIHALTADLAQLMEGISGRLEIQLACFPAAVNARYQRHTDADANGNPASADRKVTCILYCNPGWDKPSAGCLRLTKADHDKGGAGGTIDIEPIGGRLLVFLSGAMAHEVLPTAADRYAITAWLS